MAKYLMMAFTNPVTGREDEYNNWYENVAMPLYKEIPNTKPLGRYKAVPHKGYEFERENDYEYVSLYEIETDDLDAHFNRVKEFLAAEGPKRGYDFSDAIDKDRFFEPLFIKL